MPSSPIEPFLPRPQGVTYPRLTVEEEGWGFGARLGRKTDQARASDISGVIQTGLALGIAFGFSISEEALGAILAFSAALLSFLTRTQVTPLERPRDEDGRSLVPKPGG